MKTDILNPKDLFQKDVRYTIPPFQRPYVWSHDDQWEPLWNDVHNVAEDYLEKLGRSDSNSVEAIERTSPHFLGAVVLKQVPTAAKDIDQREVIDGQQRVTTLQLLLDAIQQVCEERELRPVAKRLSKLVLNDEDLIGAESHHVFKLWPTRGDREAFRHAMDNGLAVNEFKESLLVQAHEFFQRQVREWLGREGAEQIDRRAEALEATATALLQMVVIDLDSPDDPNVIFETLNARGTPLEQSDLIKNFVLSRAGDMESGIWGSLDDKWWRDEVRQGRLFRPRLDMLLNYWLAMRTGEDVSPTRVFDVFRLHSGDQQINGVMSDVKCDLGNFRCFETGKGTPEEDQFHYRIMRVMQTGVITPVLLLLLSAKGETRIRAFRALESFLIRRMMRRQTTKDYNRLVLELAIKLRKDGLERADEVVVGFLKEQTADARKWPSDREVADSLVSLPLYRLLTRGRLKLVLEGVESRLRSPKAEEIDILKDLTIEHLMPQSWNEENWPLPDRTDKELAEHERNMLIHSIGNLTLVTQKLNSTLSNASWTCRQPEDKSKCWACGGSEHKPKCKRGGLLKHSNLSLNSELSSESHWNEESIRARSKQMAGLVAERWPGPDSREW